jgi:tRNA(adenine34) deaminase
MEKYYDELLKLMDKAFEKDEVPVAALIVKDGKIIGKAHNERRKKNDVLGHAEILSIKKAEKKLGDWRLDGCDMYVSLEPCSMCTEIIRQTRIRNVYYVTKKLDFKKEYYKTNICSCDNILDTKEIKVFNNKLTEFFKRKTNR